jgi:GAF domain-containing protein
MAEKVDYSLVAEQLKELAEGDERWLPALSNAAALIWDQMSDINWVGFYLVDGSDDQSLVLGPFQGRVACTSIPFGSGVCGTAAREDSAQLVPDVHAFPGHIACDSASKSEVVVPLHRQLSDGSQQVVGVLDCDSPEKARFTERDLRGFRLLASVIEESVALVPFC